MVELKGARIGAFIRKPSGDYVAVVIHGSDVGVMREYAQGLVKAIAGSLDDPFGVTRLDDDALAQDPARLADEALAISLMGTRRVVWVRDAGGATAKALEGYLPQAKGDTLIVIEGGNLKKTDKLRQLAEKSDVIAAIACYADNDADLRDIAMQSLRAEGIRISDEALEHLVSLLGSDRALSRMEIEKLCLYGRGRDELTIADVDAVCGDASTLAIDALMDATFSGDLREADDTLARLLEAGTAPAALVVSLVNHVNMLRRLRSAMRSPGDAANVVKAARPPIFFKRQAAIARQLTLWPMPALLDAGAAIAECERRTRVMSELDNEILGRLLLTLSRSARSRARAA